MSVFSDNTELTWASSAKGTVNCAFSAAFIIFGYEAESTRFRRISSMSVFAENANTVTLRFLATGPCLQNYEYLGEFKTF